MWCTKLGGNNMNSPSYLCFLPVQPSWLLCILSPSGAGNQSDTWRCFYSGLASPTTCWEGDLLVWSDRQFLSLEMIQIPQGTPSFGLLFEGDILIYVWILHLGIFFLLSLQSNKILTKLIRKTKWFTSFFFSHLEWNRMEMSVFSSIKKSNQPNENVSNTMFGKTVKTVKT